MAQMDGTGPEKKGPGTGRRLGKCRNAATEDNAEKPGKGRGIRHGSGGGQGKRKRLRSGNK